MPGAGKEDASASGCGSRVRLGGGHPRIAVARSLRGRRRLYSLEPAPLRPLHEWLAKYQQMWNERLDRMDDYLKELQKGENGSDT